MRAVKQTDRLSSLGKKDGALFGAFHRIALGRGASLGSGNNKAIPSKRLEANPRWDLTSHGCAGPE